MPPTRPPVAALAVLAFLLLSSAPAAAIVTRSCGPDAVANTAAVLCAPPSGPCDATTVVVSASIRVPDGACVFDLGGRALRVERTLRVVGGRDGGFVIANAADVAIARRGRLMSRGDLVRSSGRVQEGGSITITSAGTIDVAGMIDTSGQYGALIWLRADGDVTFARSTKIRSNGFGGFIDFGQRQSDGGALIVDARHGSIRYAGKVQMRGANGGFGGEVDLSADYDLDVSGKTDVSGGSSDGGVFFASAGDDARVTRAFVDARSRLGGADGGQIDFQGGVRYFATFSETPEGLRPGGMLTIESSRFDVRASVNDKGFAGTGGFFDTSARGALTVADDVVIRADGAGSTVPTDGAGGIATFTAEGVPADPATGRAAIRGDIALGGILSVSGNGRDAFGGDVVIDADRDLTLSARIDVSAPAEGGLLLAGAGRNVLVTGPIVAGAKAAGGVGGTVRLVAGFTEVGTLRVAESISARGSARPELTNVALTGCPVTIDDGVTIDALADPGPTLRGKLAFFSGRPLQLGASSRYLAADGTIGAVHPATQDPVVGAGVLFDPAPLLDTVVPAEHFPSCPRCGDGPGDACAPTVRIDSYTASAEQIDVAATVASPVGLPLTGSVAVCADTGVEDVTFTWAATTCAAIHDTLELTINDTVVADVSAQIDGGCGCEVAQPFPSYTVPIDEARALLVPGMNRFGVRKTGGDEGRDRTALSWIYATVTTNGVAERVPIFDARDLFEEPGHSSFDVARMCGEKRHSAALDTAAEAVVCGTVSAVDWTGTLPCTLDLTGLPEAQDLALIVRATDGVAATPITATATLARGNQPTLAFDGCTP